MGQLNDNLTQSFEETFKLSKEQILNATYREPSPNVFLAKFAQFYSMHPNDPVLNTILETGFEKFFEVRILPYPNYAEYRLGFVGSIAYYFEAILKNVAGKYGMEVAQIVQCPIDSLVAYHAQKKVTV